ncbi:MAG: chorismate mutase [Bacteroidota bacterium]
MNSLDILIPIENWFSSTLKLPLVIAGPCSAESKEQLLSTAIELNALDKISVFRCGIWKPRTRPNCFEGVGEDGLKWLQEVKEKTNFKVAVEVANTSHVEMALKYRVDILWIGARTTVNPFSVNEIAVALKGVDIPVMVKNPVNPDLQLWIGALERFYDVGINKLAAIHRGFNTYGKKVYKNAPLWEIPIELKLKCPNLPIIIDPSHLSGSRDLLFEVAQKGLDLNMSGLIIESHNNPEKALSDAKQQITPYDLAVLLGKLKFRRESINGADTNNELEQYRSIIDDLDDQILNALTKRMQICEQIGEYKYNNDITIFQLKRWNKIIESRVNKGLSLGLERGFLQTLLELVHEESIQVQINKMNELTKKK